MYKLHAFKDLEGFQGLKTLWSLLKVTHRFVDVTRHVAICGFGRTSFEESNSPKDPMVII